MSRAADRHFERALAYLDQRRGDAAAIQLESLRALAPNDVRTRVVAAQLAWYQGKVRDAAAWALDAMTALPDDAERRCDVIETLLQTGETAAARDLLEGSAWAAGVSAHAEARRALLLLSLGEAHAALPLLDRAIAAEPASDTLRFARAQALTQLGRRAEAEVEYEACLALTPGFGLAACRLVELHSQAARRQHLDLVTQGLAQPALAPPTRAAFELAAYHVHEDCGAYAQAWAALARANALLREWHAVEATRQQQGLARLVDALVSWTPSEGVEQAGPRPIFIVGLPCAGGELLAYLLGSHPEIAVAGELVDFGQQLLRVADVRSVHEQAFLDRLPDLDLAEVGRRYLIQVGWRAHGRPWLVDAQTFNWIVAGLIRQALPRARIIHVTRDPMDVAFASYRTLETGADAWGHDFAALARHQADCRRLLQHWREVAPGTVLEVAYADLLHAPQEVLAKVLAFCGLDASAAMPVNLPGGRIRVPPRIDLPDMWRHYADELQPLRDLLGAP